MKKLLTFILCLSFMIMPSMIKAEEINEVTPYGPLKIVDKNFSQSLYGRTYKINIYGTYEYNHNTQIATNPNLKVSVLCNDRSYWIYSQNYVLNGSKIFCNIILCDIWGNTINFEVNV